MSSTRRSCCPTVRRNAGPIARCCWTDRAVLWNEVEATEKRKDAQLAREVEIALPR